MAPRPSGTAYGNDRVVPFGRGLVRLPAQPIQPSDGVGEARGRLDGVCETEVHIRSEEEMMLETFDDAYREYRRAVPMLVPRPG